MTAYLQDLFGKGLISEAELLALEPTGAGSAEELYSLTLHFPDLVADALPGGNLAKVSAIAAKDTAQTFRLAALSAVSSPVLFGKGALSPSNVLHAPGSQASPVAGSVGVGGVPSRIDHHSVPRAAGWPVRDQGLRGTCVAHAMAACKEWAAAPPAALVDQSEQYLFWAAKQLDPSPHDGTLHGFALSAMQQHGLCEEQRWPYVGNVLPGSVHHGPPPALARQAALSTLHTGGQVSGSVGAAALHGQLVHGPVSIGLPVFADPRNVQLDNWNVAGMVGYGRVMDPPPKSVVVGGHAVCLVGFEPDPGEPSGMGWFIIRNSWGTVFGSQLPQVGYWGPSPGYGQISWSYVDTYLWEICQL